METALRFKYYGQLGFGFGLAFVLETAAYDLCQLNELAYELHAECRDELLEIAAKELPGRKLYGFIDLYTGERRRPEDWRELAERGLDRVYVGMETGHDELLALVNKPGKAAELEAFVATLKTAGLSVCLIVMVGLGGRQYREDHARDTLKALRGMPLGPGDLVYLSPFVEQPGSEYQRQRVEKGLDPMDEAQIEAELERLAAKIRARGLKASRYDIREFIY